MLYLSELNSVIILSQSNSHGFTSIRTTDGSRTRTAVKPRDFKSLMSTYFITVASMIIFTLLYLVFSHKKVGFSITPASDYILAVKPHSSHILLYSDFMRARSFLKDFMSSAKYLQALFENILLTIQD